MNAATGSHRTHVHPASARRALTELLAAAGWGDRDIEDAILLASELVTNAVRHAGGVDRITVAVDERTLLFVVHDRSDRMPARAIEAPGERGGRGLEIVSDLSDDWGATRDPGGGKHAWFRLTR